METIRLLVQNIMVIVILAVFLEMLLPAGEMRGYIRLVMGMLVIMAVLQAAAGLLDSDFALEVPDVFAASEPPAGSLGTIMEDGANFFEKQQQEALSQYKKGLAKQVAGLARLNGEVEVVGVNVLVEENTQASDYGHIREIRLTLAAPEAAGPHEDQTSSLVEPIEVEIKKDMPGGGVTEGKTGQTGQEEINEPLDERPGENAGGQFQGRFGESAGKQPPSQSVTSLVNTLADFYNLSTGKIKVKYLQ